ncbi:15836_t:CDS:10 [Funneliformis geosporum]|nr:15836_t:CDS:10 [Funneliformis geosporum]
MAPASTPFVQQPTSIEHNGSSDVHGGSEIPSPPQLLNDGITNERPSTDLDQRGIITNTISFSADNMRRSEERVQTRDDEPSDNLPSSDFSQIMHMNLFSANSMQTSEENDTFRVSDRTQDEEPSDNLLTNDFSQIMRTNLFSADYSQHGQQSDYAVSNPQAETLSKESQEKNRDESKSIQSQSDDSTIAIQKKPKFENDLKDKIDPKKNIREVLKNRRYDSIDSIEYGKDLAEHIPGLYRLLDLYKDDGSNGLVDKIIISKDSLKKLCNDMVPHDLLIASQFSVNANKPSLRPGIYLIVVNADLGLVIHWPEVECYEENASSQRKKNMTNLHRYLTKLTDHQLCLLSDKDLECFDWKLDNSDIDSDEEDDESRFEFEVKKSQEEQEDFRIYPGFKVNLSEKIKDEINNNATDDIPLHPIVVESAKNQSFVTRKLIKSSFQLRSFFPTFSANDFSRELNTRLQERSLHINREEMNMKSLEILVKHGLRMENELLGPLREAIKAAKLKSEKKKNQEKNATNKDIEFILNLARKRLNDCYSSFEVLIVENSFSRANISDEDLKRIHDKYPDIESQIDEKIKINSDAWKKLKIRYILITLIVQNIIKTAGSTSVESEESTIKIFYEMFVDEETDSIKLVKKYTEKQQSDSWFNFRAFWDFVTFSNIKIDRAYDQSIKFSQNMSDIIFIQKLTDTNFFGKFNEIKQKVIDAFFEKYQIWRNVTFTNNIKEILPKVAFNRQLTEKLNEEFELEKKEIETHEFERICKVIEEKYQNGPMQINIINITDIYKSNHFRFHHEIETTKPNQLQITIYETSLNQADTFQIQDNELHIPNITLPLQYNSDQFGFTFHVDPAVYDFRKISQFDNRKFLVLYNKKMQKVEIFFDTVQRLTQIFKASYPIKPFKTLNTDEHFIIAINEPKELIAIYNTKKAMVNTEELCFVEKGGRTRIFSLINLQFRPAVCNLPTNTANVLSSPDGSCIVAFVKEKLVDDNPIDNVAGSEYDNENKHITDDTEKNDNDSVISADNKEVQNNCNKDDSKDIYRAYVYFCSNFGGPVSKVIDLPTTFQSLELLQFTCINNLQTHLISLDLQNGYFNSVIVKITLEKTQYRFQERRQKKSLGLVKLIDSSHRNVNYTIVEGKNTQFEKIVRNGEFIVVNGEKFNVIEVLSNTKLKIDGNFKPRNGFDNWMEFRIEPKTKLNGLIDAYKLMFEKYPVESCIVPEQNRLLNLKIVLDIEVDDEEIEEYGEKFKDYISEIFEDLRRSTKKPTTILKKFSTSIITFQELDIESMKFQKNYSSGYELGEWIIQLCCLIPIQIAVAKDNVFQPLKDGLLSSNDVEIDDDYSHHVDSIAKNISFGWYEGIFRHFGDKKVKVVSSMGEQSCGKSFMLNHLVGTTFDGSAMRCTEGVWMSLVNTKKYIYVALYFEGLNSLERNLFLTLFNTVVSNLILFKNQFAVNRDMSSMFQRFQDGAMLFESDPKIFQAKLCIIIKDVPKADKDDIVKEFKSRFSQLVSEEGEDNFISRMYKGGQQEAKYENARTFLQNTKVIMTKLKICDWGSLDENLIQIRVATLKRLLPTNRDTGEPIADSVISLSEILHDFENSDTILLPDSDILLYDENESFVRLSEELRSYFEEHIRSRKNSSDDLKWFANFNIFFKYIIERRVLRVQAWYMQNTAKFPQDNNDIVNGKYSMEQEIGKLTLLWTLCGLTCHQCGLKCVKNPHKNISTPTCSHKAGHEGKHACDKINHLCGKPCNLIDKRNCQKVCSKEIGHEDDHLCQSTRHYCGKACSLSTKTQKGDYCCPNKCIIPYEEEHDSHRCENETCPIQCPILDCQKKCQDNNHFHAYSNFQVDHFLILEPKRQEEVYKGLVTNITFTKYIQLSERLICIKKIPPNEFIHTGKHTHEEDGFHFCDAKCQFCEYFCTSPYGHAQNHTTTHGNMTQTEFAGEDNNEFEYRGHKLRVGDQGTVVLCNLYCKDLGRHRHIDYCQNEENCKSLLNQGQDLQHIHVNPNPDKPKDFISHKLFWDRTGFKEQQEFAKCDHECSDDKHKSQGSTSAPPTKSFCELSLFHDQLNPSSNPPNDYGYISLDGHHFNCENPSTREAAFHIIFVMDRSGSMNGKDKKPIPGFPIYNKLMKNHDNRIGAVYHAVYQFMDARIKSAPANQNQAMRDKVIVPFENRDLTDPNELLNEMIKHQARGGTDFNLAIQKAGFLIATYFDATRANIIIFLSDGQCGIPTNQLKTICKQNETRGSPLYLYTVLFSSGLRSHSLEEMANIAQSYHSQNSSSSALRCQFTCAIDEVSLVNHFTGVAESLRKHKPALLKKNSGS